MSRHHQSGCASSSAAPVLSSTHSASRLLRVSAVVAAVAAAIALHAPVAHAQDTLASFTSAQPYTGLTLGSGNDLFGTAYVSGGNSTVFTTAPGIDTLAGAGFSGGNFYGTTEESGVGNGSRTSGINPGGTAVAPEPTALLLLAPGALGLIAARRRASRKA